MLEGQRDYNLEKSELREVVRKLKRINQVPEGYHYPELNRKRDKPQELQAMEQRKEMHLKQKKDDAAIIEESKGLN